MEQILTVCLIVLMGCVALAFVRLIRGPRLQDRVVALDLMASLGVVIIAIYSMLVDEAQLIDVAIIVALISFLSTIAFSFYGERVFR